MSYNSAEPGKIAQENTVNDSKIDGKTNVNKASVFTSALLSLFSLALLTTVRLMAKLMLIRLVKIVIAKLM